MGIKNLSKAAQRIKKAIKRRERIILYGDADIDGVCSVLILEQTIKSLGGAICAFYFPDREKEGYGITKTALKKLKRLSPAVLAAADLGISNFEEIKLARELGFEVIIVDHHEPIQGIPEANIVVDPKQPGDTYPFKGFAACGLAWKLAETMLGKSLSGSLRANLLELAALGTIADMMPRTDDNLPIIGEGLKAMENSWRPGIRAFFELPHIMQLGHIQTKVEQMIAALNVREVKEGLPAAFRLLSCPALEEAKTMAEEFAELSKIRKERVQSLAEEIREGVTQSVDDRIIFAGGAHFDFVLLGSVASILANEYKKPTFLFKQKGNQCLGSVRAPKGFDTVKAMASCAHLLISYGGHPPASGFCLASKNVEPFRKCLIEYFQKQNRHE